MMYPFMTLDDKTQIVHSDKMDDGRVKVYLEKPDAKDGFHHMVCYLPGYQLEDIDGFNEIEVEKYVDIVHSVAHLIMEFAETGGFESALGF